MPSGVETALFARLIDHAPLFPPARMPLPEALDDHRAALSSDEGWIVRRFVCPASTLAELNREPLALSVVLDAQADLDDPRVEAIEVPPNRELRMFSGEIYVEAGTESLPQVIPSLAENATRAKVRCGPNAPTIDELAAAIRACRENAVPFKATAGLHHAVRQGGQHGFLNLLAAAMFGDEEAALGEDDADAFRQDGDAFRWRDRTATQADIERGRELFVAFGSCSFSEPVDDLRALGFLTT